MLKQMLYLHWKAVRWPLAPFVLLSLGLPMMILRAMQKVPPGMADTPTGRAVRILSVQQEWLSVFPLLAFIIGATVALTAWSWDHQARHVYSLSLPMSRAKYAVLKIEAGLLIALLPVLALVVGTMIGLAFTPVPNDLHTYPLAFGSRFMLAVLISYAVTFALAASTVRTTALLIVGFIVITVFGTIVIEFINEMTARNMTSPASLLFDAFLNWPGPFAVFGGSWMLIDV